FAHDSANNQKTEAGAAGFGREIWFKHATEIFRRNSAARVREFDDDMRIVLVGADPQNSSSLHRFETVLDHIVKSLLHLVAIELEQRKIGAQLLFDDDVAVFDFRREES